MNKTIITGLALSACFLSFSSFAEEVDPAYTDGHFYAQLEVGKTALNVDNHYFDFATKKQDTSFALGFGYEFSSMNTFHFGLEWNSWYMGEVTFYDQYNIVEMAQAGGKLLMVVSKDFNPSITGFVKGGIAGVRQAVNLSNDYYNGPVADYAYTLPTVATGLRFKINKNLSLMGTVSHNFGDRYTLNHLTTPEVASSTSAQLGLRVDFG